MQQEAALWHFITGRGRNYLNKLLQRTDTCVLMARLGSLLFEQAGVPCTVHSVTFLARNRQYMQLIEQHRRLPATPDEARAWLEAGAYSVVIDDATATPGKLAGHLILETPTYIGDPSLDQGSRPNHDLKLSPWFMKRDGLSWNESEPFYIENEQGTLVMYSKRPRPATDWERSPDWTFCTSASLMYRNFVALIK